MPLKDTNCRNAKPQDKPYRLYDELRDLLAELISADAEARRLWTLLGVLP